MTATTTLEDLCINTIRILSATHELRTRPPRHADERGRYGFHAVDAVSQVQSQGSELRLIATSFVLSAGHGSMLLYSLLHLTGYDLPLDELKRFRKLGSEQPGHPERGRTGRRRSRDLARWARDRQRRRYGDRREVARGAL